jgi:phosphoglycolate phosphatase
MTRFKLVALDFDGTLADTAGWFFGEFNGLAARHGFRQVNGEEIEELRHLPTREIVRALRIRYWQIPAIARDFRARIQQASHQIQLFPGVGEFLERLSRTGIHVAILSSNGEPAVRTVLGPHADLVDRFSCSAAVFGKHAKLNRLGRTLKLQPREILVVGDETRDVEAARRSGASVAAVSWGYAELEAILVA